MLDIVVLEQLPALIIGKCGQKRVNAAPTVSK